MRVLINTLMLFFCHITFAQEIIKSFDLFTRFDSNSIEGVNITNIQNESLVITFNYDNDPNSIYSSYSLLNIDRKGNLIKNSPPRYCNIKKNVSISKTAIVEQNRILISHTRYNNLDSVYYSWIDIFNNNLELIDSIGYNFGSRYFGATKFQKNGKDYILSYIEVKRDSTTKRLMFSPKIIVLDSLLNIKKAVTISGNTKLNQHIDNDIVIDSSGNLYMFHGVLFANYAYSPDPKVQFYYDQYHPWNTFLYITKLDKNYNELWTKNLNTPVWDRYNNLFLSKDQKKLVLASNRDTTNFFDNSCCMDPYPTLIYIDTSGALLEEKINYHTYKTVTSPYYNIYQFVIFSTIQCRNGDFVEAGYVLGQNDNPKLYKDGLIWLSRLDSEGKTIWFRIIHNPLLNLFKSRLKLPLETYLLGVVEMPNGNIAGTGLVQDTFPDQKPFINNIQILYINLTSDGCFNGNCDTIMNLYEIVSRNEDTRLNIGAKIYPNPSSGDFTLSIDSESPLNDAQLLVYDIQGKMYIQRKIDIAQHWQEQLHIDAPPGMYFVHVMHGGKHYVERLTLVN
jgi:Secretion system C-terminal sorting domain